MATVTLRFSVKNKYILTWTPGPTMNQEVGGWGKPKAKRQAKGRAKPWGRKCTAMAQLRIPRVCSYDALLSALKTSLNVLLRSVVNLCLHFLFRIDNLFDFWFGSSKTFAKSFDPFRGTTCIIYIHSLLLRHLLEWIFHKQCAGLNVWT